jgi:hypothetical protein
MRHLVPCNAWPWVGSGERGPPELTVHVDARVLWAQQPGQCDMKRLDSLQGVQQQGFFGDEALLEQRPEDEMEFDGEQTLVDDLVRCSTSPEHLWTR